LFTPEERERLRADILAAARADPRISGGALTGSASVGNEDRWSDVDLAFGVRDPSGVAGTLADFSARMYDDHQALHHVDVLSGAWVYRVFLLPSTLQVDLAFAPESEFGARAPSFRLVFGSARDGPPIASPRAEELVGYGWLYALHARSSITRARLWQAEYMISAMRDQILALACVRLGLPAREGRGIDRLPREITEPLEEALVRRLDAAEAARAFAAAIGGLLREISAFDPSLATRLVPALDALRESASASAERPGDPHPERPRFK
jgi:hypothetical protein